METFPSRERAEILLSESASLNPGPWEAHSRFVALGAELIATRLAGVDPDRAYVTGLLHDIGRRFGVTGMRHSLDGYHFLNELGYSGAARICVTHSYPDKADPHGATPWDGTAQEWQFIRSYLERIDYDDYDRLIQLCDSLALPDGFCVLEKRLLDVAVRYGCDAHTESRWRAFIQLKEYFESKLGGSIYRLLPGVIENTFGWGERH